MPRRERPLDDGNSPLLRFAADLRRLRQKVGSPTYRVLAQQAHYSAATLSDAAGGRKLPGIEVTLAYVRACDGDLDEWRQRWHEVAAELAAESADARPEVRPDDQRPPYVGLAAFQPADADLFFGRERLVEALLARLARHRFVAVFGASGAGKSSALRAGLLPAWTGKSKGTSPRPVVLFTPGPHPVEECAIVAARATGGGSAALYAELVADRRGLHRIVRQSFSGDQAGDLLLVVDQFEEVFTLCRDREERGRFIDLLITAALAETSRCRVVIGVRADFYASCTRHPQLIDAFDGAQVAVGPMNDDELRRAITQPAAAAGCVVEGALLATLATHAQGQVGVLPMLSHALLETWHRRRGNTLTLAGFLAAGGIDGALARTAETVYSEWGSAQQGVARDLFLRLTAFGEGTEDTKRRIRRDELPGTPDDTAPVLERLSRARLLILDRDTLEMSHEALIRCWPRLHGWLTEDREGIRIHRQLTEAASAWQALSRDPGALYRGARLALVDGWAGTAAPSLTGLEEQFLDASRREQAAEREAARRHSRHLRSLVVLLSVLLALATATTGYALRAGRTAATQRDIATSQKVANEAAALRGTAPATAAQVGLAAYRLAPTIEARSSLLSTFATPYASQLADPDGLDTAVFSPDGHLLAAAGDGGTLRLWRVADPHRPEPLATTTGHTGAVRTAAFGSDGRSVATGGDDGTVRILDVTDPAHPAVLAVLAAHTGPVTSVASGPTGGWLATGGDDGVVVLWDVAEPRAPRRFAALTGHVGRVTSVVVDPAGRTLATGGVDGTVRLWDLAEWSTSGSQSPRQPLAPRAVIRAGAVTSAAFRPDGRVLATGSTDHTVRLWDLTQPLDPPELAILTGHTDTVTAVAFSPDGTILASAGVDAAARLWDVTDPRQVQELTTLTGHIDAIRSITFHPDGRTVATASADYTVRLWDLPGPLLLGHRSSVYAVTFGPDGRMVASGGYDNTVRLWDITDLNHPAGVATLTEHTAAVNSVAFRPDGRVLASGSHDRTVRLWDVTDPRRTGALAAPLSQPESVEAVAFSPDGRILATGGGDRTIRLWDVTDATHPQPLATLTGHTQSVNAIAFSLDGRRLASGSSDHTVRLWDLTDARNPRELGTANGHGNAITSVAFGPDGRTLASAGEDRLVRLWEVADARHPRPLATLTGYTDGVKAVAFSPDGHTLATASSDRSVRLWDIARPDHPREIALLSGHSKPVDDVAFSPDGTTIATGSEDRNVVLWTVDPERVAERICTVVAPTLTRAELADHLPDLREPPCPRR